MYCQVLILNINWSKFILGVFTYLHLGITPGRLWGLYAMLRLNCMQVREPISYIRASGSQMFLVYF